MNGEDMMDDKHREILELKGMLGTRTGLPAYEDEECDHRHADGRSAYLERLSGQVCSMCGHFEGNWET